MANRVLADLAVRISANTAEFSKGLEKSRVALKGVEGSIKQANKALNDFRNTSTGITAQLSQINNALVGFGVGFGVFQLIQGVKSAIRTIGDFEKQLSTVKAITGATGNEFNKLRENALKLGSSTKFTATEVASLQVAYGRLGFTTSEILKATEATLSLAAATDSDLAKAAEIAGSTVRGFGLDASETVRVTDVMAASFSKTALQLDSFSEAMKFVAPVAKAAGISIEEITALLGVLADAGIKGSNAGTALRRILVDLSKDGRPFQEQLKDLIGSGLTLQSSFDEVGRVAQTALLVIGEGENKTKRLTNEFNNVEGAAKNMADVISDNLTGDIIKLESAFEGLILSGGSVSSVLREITQDVTKFINAINGPAGEYVIKYFKLVSTIPRETIKAFGEISQGIRDIIDGTSNGKTLEEFIENLRKIGGADAPNPFESLTQSFEEWVRLQNETQDSSSGAVDNLVVSLKSLKEQKEELNKQFAATNVNDRKELANKIAQIQAVEKQIDAVERYRSSLISLKAVEVIDPFENISIEPDVTIRSFDSSGFLPFQEELAVYLASIKEFSDDSSEAVAESQQRTRDELQRTITSAMMLGDAFGDAFGSVISGQATFAQGLARFTDGVVQQYGRQAIAAAIAKAVQSSPTAFGVVAAASAATAAISALLRSAAGYRGGRGGASSFNRAGFSSPNSYSFAQDSSGIRLQVDPIVIRGQDLYVSLTNYEKNNRNTRNG